MTQIEKDKIFNQSLTNLKIKEIPIRNIYEQAMRYKYRTTEQPIEVSEDSIKRIMVNHIRHKCTNYDYELSKMRRVKSNDQAYYYLYKNHVLQEIETRYSYLSDECEHQKTNIILARKIR